ncbi:MAG TPA: UDP-N-acetylmuramate--L-alanine ligase [Actinomycetota bacterium]|nr:UDP-N-acetylmuramate--L-alanine ligase [Actinomycetota bacterium]
MSRLPGLPVAPGGRVHLVGIGGAGMSAIARVLREAGYPVSGSDQRESTVLSALRALGVTVEIGHRARRVAGAALVVASAAVPESNVELEAARTAGIPVLTRGECLARIVEGLRTVAVAGTHGKTTTSGMVATMLQVAGREPTWLLGADLARRGAGGHLGGGTVAVVEADEAYQSFLWLAPEVAVVTNVEDDHLDHYGGLAQLIEAFGAFVAATTGTVILCGDDARAAALAAHATGDLVVYGLETPAVDLPAGLPPDLRIGAEGIETSAEGSRFTLTIDGVPAVPVALRIAGRHNVCNSLAAAGVGLALGLEPRAVADGLAQFAGASRRFEYRGSVLGADLVDDYAHHPTEIAATLEAARWGPWRRVLAVFQPHLYSRTQAMWPAFGSALARADVVVVTDVYGAREQPIPGVTGKLVVDAVCDAAPGRRVAYLPHLEEAADYVRGLLRPGDLLLSLGAGDITTLPQRVLAHGDAVRPER